MARKRKDPPAGDVLLFQLRAVKIQAPKPEHRFHDRRQWRFDFAWLELKLAVEIEGVLWGKRNEKTGKWEQKVGRHQTAEGMAEDCIKYAEAEAMGWTVLRFTQKQIRDGTALPYIEAAYHKRQARARQIQQLAERI